ncbi:glycosyltransferase family 39 protein [Patescibacteria group bacterium]|nr:glycosyltransferase family 39 protein [Patescibacteria group bacterium]
MNKKLGLILIFAFILRIPLLNGSFWLDEAAQALEIIRPLSQQLNITADFQPPLLHLILHFAQYFSYSESWLRIIGALIPGLITILFTYKLADKLFGKNTATLASLFLATSAFHIFYSQELRPYSLATMFALISMYYYFLFFQNKPKEKYLGLKLSLVNLLGLYSSYLFPFLMIGQLIFATFKNQERLSKYLKTQIIPILGFLPWLPTFFKQLDAGEMVRVNLPGWDKVVSLTPLKAIPLVVAKFIFGNLDVEPNQFFIIFGAMVIIPILVLLFVKFKKLTNKKKYNLLFTLAWLILPLISSWLVSFYIPVIRAKRLLFLLPAFYILAAYLIDNFLKNTKKINFALAILLMLSIFSINIISTTFYYTNPSIQRENWKGLYQEISETFSPANTVFIYSFTDKFAPIKWYDTKNYPAISTGELLISKVDDLANTLKRVVEYENVLVFDYLRDLSDPDRKIEKELANFGFKEIGALDYPNIGFVRIFIKPHLLIGVK